VVSVTVACTTRALVSSGTPSAPVTDTFRVVADPHGLEYGPT
jgi:hypothetical protein